MKKLAIFLALISYGTSFSQGISTDRPDQTEASNTLNKGSFQLESGLVFLKNNDESYKSFLAPSNLIRYGVTDKVEFRIFTQYETKKYEWDGANRKYSGLNDLELGVKVQLFQKENSKTEVAFLSHVIIPTASDELGSSETGVVNKLSISHALSGGFGLGYNVGYNYTDSLHFFTYSLALGYSISDSVGFFVEPYGILGAEGFFENNFDFGFTFLLNPNFQLDTSYGFGFNNDVHYFSAGFSWHVPNLFVKN